MRLFERSSGGPGVSQPHAGAVFSALGIPLPGVVLAGAALLVGKVDPANVDTSKQVGDRDHLKSLPMPMPRRRGIAENDPQDVAFEYKLETAN
jgi:hypothetical protein